MNASGPGRAGVPGGPAVLLGARGIAKAFGATRALAGADLEVREREIHGLVGAHGAGKSTLARVIAGHHRADAGAITYRGYEVALRSTRDALRVGIAMVMQEARLVADLTVLENIFLPLLGRPGPLDPAALRAKGLALLANLGQADALPLDAKVRRLSAAQKQVVEIARALGGRVKLLILDEPTASFGPREVDRLFDILARLRTAGCGLVLVSHRLDEILAVADRVTVLRDGRTATRAHPTAGLTEAALRRAMAGTDPGALPRDRPAARHRGTAPVVLDVRNLAAPPAVRDVSFVARAGEILGLGGLLGAGRSETLEAVFGLRPRTGGTVTLAGGPLRAGDPRGSIRAGVGFVADDRRTRGIVPDLGIEENLLLAHLGAKRGLLRGYRACAAKAAALVAALALPAERLPRGALRDLPAGMGKKIAIARALLLEPRLLILDEPTKGVDHGTRAGIHALLRDVAARGTAIVVASSDVEELLGLSDRVVVMSGGRSVADLPSAALDARKLALLAAPGTAMARNTAMLDELTRENGGAGFWALIEDDRLICLNAVVVDPGADPGFRPGEARAIADTPIPAALSRREATFVAEPARERATILVPIRSPRGQDRGWVGLCVSRRDRLPPAPAVKFRIETLAATP